MAETAVASLVPDGYRLVTHHAGYGQHNGPFYQKAEGEGFVRAFRVLDRHLNRAGIIHGGMLATFADMILGQTVHGSIGGPAFTIRLVTDYLGPARAGDWLEGRGRLLRKTRSLAFAEAQISAGGRSVAKASGIFRIDSRAPRPAE